MAQDTVSVKITLLDGSVEEYEFTPPDRAEWSRGSKFEKMLSSNVLIFECEGTVKIIPLSGVRSLEMSPAPATLPVTVTRGLRRIK